LTPSRCPLWELAHYGKYRSCTTSTWKLPWNL
jgi:hypothetical protein